MTAKVDILSQALEHLEQALHADVAGKERDWAEGVAGGLTHVVHALRKHATETENPSGLYAEVDLTRPTLARQVGELRREHGDFLHKALDLHNNVQKLRQAFTAATRPVPMADPLPAPPVTTTADFSAIRNLGDQLLASLSHHQQLETDLVLESVTTDLGAGD
jgi:hypothetical protein